MAIKPVSDWASSYEEMFFKDMTAEKAPIIWGDWVDKNTQGLSASPPWSGATVTLMRPAFPPVTVPASPSPVPLCTMIANGWMSYILSASWTPPPPIPPFSVITMCMPSASGVAAAQAALLNTLIATFTPPAVPGEAYQKAQAMKIATAFYTATMSSGIMLSGLTVPSPLPLPLVLPMLPVM